MAALRKVYFFKMKSGIKSWQVLDFISGQEF